MGSSGGNSDFEPEGTAPPPPAGMVSPQGQSTPYTPHFINFLGDTNVPSTGLTPEMLQAIMATQNPQPRAPPPVNPGAPVAAAPGGGSHGMGGRDQLAYSMMRGGGERGGGNHSGAGGGRGGNGWGGH